MLAIKITVLASHNSQEDAAKITADSIQSQSESPDNFLIIKESDNLSELIPNESHHWIVLLHAGDMLTKDAISLIKNSSAKINNSATQVIYFDHNDIHSSSDDLSPILKPEFNLDLLHSYPYMGRALAVRADLLHEQASCFKGIFDLPFSYELVLKSVRNLGPKGFFRIPRILANLKTDNPSTFAITSEMWQKLSIILANHLNISEPDAKCLEGPGPGTFHVLYPLKRTPSISIIISTENKLNQLSQCIESVLSTTNYPEFEILISKNEKQSTEINNFLNQLSTLDTDKIRIIEGANLPNFSAINNLAVAHARGEFILLLDDSVCAVQADWLGHMVRHAVRDGVGVVGARLLDVDGKLQHAGIIMGLHGPAENPYFDLEDNHPGYLFRAQVTQNFSATSAACLLVSKAIYEQAGGLDEKKLTTVYSDVDFCLRVIQTGRRIVWSSLATLLYQENKKQRANPKTITSEEIAMYQCWPEIIANDPAYNPNFSLVENGYEIEINNLLREFKSLENDNTKHKIITFAADNSGCGHYRILQPIAAMIDTNLCTGGNSPEIFTPNLALRSEADTFVFQRPNTEAMLTNLKALTTLKGIKKIYEVDDLLTNLPIKSVHYHHIPRDLRGKMVKAIGLCDRLVVSTEALAHELSGYNDDVRVALNRMSPAMWGTTPPVRTPQARPKPKPRIGWAGGIGHLGDIEMIAAVIKELADQVDWVFVGMCPDSIRPYVKEFHPGVPTLEYPGLLMAQSQSWDLAIAPLEVNPFNECKSNLKLLEYGWCGVPVVCSDVTPYQCDLPATRVKNKHKNWREAILEQIHDRAASQTQGLDLQQRVAKDWMLTGQNLKEWYSVWTD